MAKKKSDLKDIKFDEAIKRLENIVEQLEDEETLLEESVELFEEGKQLSTICMERLQAIEKKIKVLIDQGDEVQFKDFSASDEESE